MLQDDWQYNNEEESEMGQLHAIHLNLNAVGDVRRQLELQALKPSRTHCCECGEPIPERRRQAIQGVQLCVDCQSLLETK